MYIDQIVLYRDMNKSQEFMIFLRQALTQEVPEYQALVTGSVAELPCQYISESISDIDVMRIKTHQVSVSSSKEIPIHFRGTAYIIETLVAHPGFARLRLAISTLSSEHELNLSGTRYLHTDEFIRKDWPINGPANTSPIFTFKQVKEFIIDSDGRNLETGDLGGLSNDLVSSISCKFWPRISAEWITRERPQSWPSQVDIDRIVKEGCHLIPKPHFANRSDKTVFRFSFSVAEITLLHTWSSVQMYIYHILRLVKSKIVKQCEANGRKSPLCTYYFKTLMLWACERRPSEFWDESRIATSVGELFCEMIECLLEKKCPNYFIPENNMMDHFPDYMHFEEEILMLLSFNERTICELVASVPMATKDNRLCVKLSRKLLSLGQMIYSRDILFINRWRIQSAQAQKQFHESSACTTLILAEFEELYSAIEAHLQLINFGHSSFCSFDCLACNQAVGRFEKATTDIDSSCVKTHHVLTLGDNIEDNFEQMLFKQGEENSLLDGSTSKCIKTDTKKQREDDSDVKSKILTYWKRDKGINRESAAENKALCVEVTPNEDLRSYFFEHILFQMLDKLFPKVTYFICMAYRANFYYTFLHDYSRALSRCEEAIRCMDGLEKMITVAPTYDYWCSVVLSSKLMPLFDNYIQTVFGFVLLQVKILETMKMGFQNQDICSPEGKLCPFVVRLLPMQFIMYVKIQCLNWTRVDSLRCRISNAAALISRKHLSDSNV